MFATRAQWSVPGYDVGEQIGQGGMGLVYRARDLRLDREVALKTLKEEYCDDGLAKARFRAEATVTGQLQHPGIPPVHELGELPDGRPFLAMKLVKGQTLQALLQERAAELGRFIAIFEQVCHAVGYAHAHRVIHRDLKPSNIMVGAHGEVQVMDWGLAKVLSDQPGRHSEPAEADPEATRTLRTQVETPEASSATRTGAVLGTLAYMPPEQAGGEARKLDARSDVFALGAILCQILTGHPPYRSQDVNEVRLQAVRGELADAFARLDACGAEPELVALCKRCLAFRQEDRPADANAVAAEVAQIRQASEERARQAELERERALVREAEQRKRRRQAMLLGGIVAAVLLVATIASIVGAFIVAGLNRQLERANAELRDSNAKLEAARKEAAEGQAETEAVLTFVREKVFAAARPAGQEGGL
ncbi:MAG: serine/threonine protein kinase, partial [Gemmataceae bacterium]